MVQDFAAATGAALPQHFRILCCRNRAVSDPNPRPSKITYVVQLLKDRRLGGFCLSSLQFAATKTAA
jgi:hypothetical protein